jgi:hypothetical protein
MTAKAGAKKFDGSDIPQRREMTRLVIHVREAGFSPAGGAGFCGNRRSTKKGFTPLGRKPLHGNECRREDSNLHSLNGNQVLNLARLPVPPLRLQRPCRLQRRRRRCFNLMSGAPGSSSAAARGRAGLAFASPQSMVLGGSRRTLSRKRRFKSPRSLPGRAARWPGAGRDGFRRSAGPGCP